MGHFGSALEADWIDMNQKRKVFIHYQNDPDNPSSLSHNFVGAILEGQNGALWLGTIGGDSISSIGRQGNLHISEKGRLTL